MKFVAMRIQMMAEYLIDRCVFAISGRLVKPRTIINSILNWLH
jgi:hypothetical protein